jgi:hypothetical protein
MGRMKIKKKDTVIPFRETLAYRMALVTGSILVFAFAAYQLIVSIQAASTVGIILSGVLAAASTLAVVFNTDRLKTARVSTRTARRMGRR